MQLTNRSRQSVWLSLAALALGAGCVWKSDHLKMQKTLGDKISGLETQLKAKTDECTTLSSNLSQCEQKKKDLIADLTKVKETLDKAQKNLVVCQDMMHGKSEKLSELRNELQKKEEELQKKEDALKRKIEELQAKERELQASIDRINLLQAQVSRLRQIFDDLQDKLQALVKAGKLTIKMVRGNLVVQLPERILFALGSAVVKPEGRAAITSVVEFLKNMKHRWQVVGHTDTTGSARGNWALSMRRAWAFGEVMLKAGMPPELISVAGAGQYDPVAANDDEENRALNRRTELLLVPDLEELLAPVRSTPPPAPPAAQPGA
jgi:chemotaxis protein MotB